MSKSSVVDVIRSSLRRQAVQNLHLSKRNAELRAEIVRLETELNRRDSNLVRFIRRVEDGLERLFRSSQIDSGDSTETVNAGSK